MRDFSKAISFQWVLIQSAFSVTVVMPLFPTTVLAQFQSIELDTEPPVKIYCTYGGYSFTRQLWTKFNGGETIQVVVQGCRNRDVVKCFCKRRRCDLMVHSGPLSDAEREQIRTRFQSKKGLPEIQIGQFVNCVVVNSSIPIQSLSVEQVGAIFRGEINDWSELGGPARKIVPIGSGNDTNTFYVLETTCSVPQEALRKDVVVKKTQSAVIAAVKKQPGAIGYFSYEWNEIKGVRTVKISATSADGKSKSEPYGPTDAAIATGDYPLTSSLVMVVRPTVPPEARDFVEFLKEEEAGTIGRQRRVFTRFHRQQELAKIRQSAAKKGEGPSITLYGPRAGLSAMQGLAQEFVKAKTPIQLQYTVKPQAVAVEEFLKRETQLLLVDEPFAGATLDKHLAGLINLRPERFDIGQVGVGVIVHPLNKLDWFKVEELKQIYSNRLRHWTGLKRYAASAATTADGSAADTTINKYGLRGRGRASTVRPVAELFREVILGGKRLERVPLKADSTEVINAVSLDTNAIGFINLADLNPHATNVKLVGIVPTGKAFPETARPLEEAVAEASKAAESKEGSNRDGQQKSPSRRFAQWDVSGGYPLLRQWSLYVDRRSDDVVWQFAEFLEAREPGQPWLFLKPDEDDKFFSDGTEVTTTLREFGLIRPSRDAPTDTAKSGPKPVFVLPQ